MSLLTERNGWAKIWLCWKWVTPQFVVHAWPLTQVWPELRNLNVQNEWWRVLCLHVQCAVKRAKGPCLTFSLCAGTLESMFLIKQVMSWTLYTKEIDNFNQGGQNVWSGEVKGWKWLEDVSEEGRETITETPSRLLTMQCFPTGKSLKKDKWNPH